MIGNSSGQTPQRGFTLLELLVTLVLMAILSTAFIPLIHMMEQRSAESLLSVKKMYALQNQMELLVQAFENDVGGKASTFHAQVAGLIESGVSLEENRLVKVTGGAIADATTEDTLLLVSIRDSTGYRLRRLFGDQ